MKRNIFSSLLSSKTIKIIVLFFLVFSVLNINKSEARILIKASDIKDLIGTKVKDDIDILYDPNLNNSDKLDFKYNKGGKDIHSIESGATLSLEDLSAVNKYLAQQEDNYTKQFFFNLYYVDKIAKECPSVIGLLNNDKDVGLSFVVNSLVYPTTPINGAGGGAEILNNVVKEYCSTQVADTDSKIKEDSQYNRITQTLTFIKDISPTTKLKYNIGYMGSAIYGTNYEKLFNTLAQPNDAQFNMVGDFLEKSTGHIGNIIINHYFSSLSNYLSSSNTTPVATAELKKWVAMVSDTTTSSQNCTADANGTLLGDAPWWSWGGGVIGATIAGVVTHITSGKTTGLSINCSFLYLPKLDYSTLSVTTTDATSIINATQPTEATNTDPLQAGGCDTFMESMNSNTCNPVSYIINSFLDLLTTIFKSLLNLVTSLFDWTVKLSIYNFKSWITGTGAYDIWRKVILSLVTSLLLPLVLYLIIRMLIDNDTTQIKKVLPKILITALFVYFSFSITGWIVDQTNILSIYMYRSMHSTDQSIGDSMSRLLVGDTDTLTGQKSMLPNKGQASSILVYLVQLVIVGVSILVFFQAITLLFIRALTLVLAMIFSPIMLLPEGINKEYIDKYREMVIKYFTNAAIMAPIFMFMILIAMKIGEAASNLIQDTSSITGIPNAPGGFIAAALTGIIVIVVLELAIMTAKKMSGDIGVMISDKVNALAGNVAFGGASKLMKGGVNRLANNERIQGWMKKGGTGSRTAYNLLKSAQGKTYDLRNSKNFQRLAGSKDAFGAGSTETAKSRLDNKYYKEREFHNTLTDSGKEKNLGKLRSTFNPRGGFATGKIIADRLGDKEKSKLSLKERADNDKAFNDKFDKALGNKDETKRNQETLKTMDEHFKDNGEKEKHFSEAIKNDTDLKKKFDDAVKKNDKQEVLKVVKDFEDSQKKEHKYEEGKMLENLTKNTETQNTTNFQKIQKEQIEKMGGEDEFKKKLADRKAELINRAGGQDVYKEKLASMNKRVTEAYKEKNKKESEEYQEKELNRINAEKRAGGDYNKKISSYDIEQMKNNIYDKYGGTDKARERVDAMNKKKEEAYQEQSLRESIARQNMEKNSTKIDNGYDIPKEYTGTYSRIEDRKMFKQDTNGNNLSLNKDQRDMSFNQQIGKIAENKRISHPASNKNTSDSGDNIRA